MAMPRTTPQEIVDQLHPCLRFLFEGEGSPFFISHRNDDKSQDTRLITELNTLVRSNTLTQANIEKIFNDIPWMLSVRINTGFLITSKHPYLTSLITETIQLNALIDLGFLLDEPTDRDLEKIRLLRLLQPEITPYLQLLGTESAIPSPLTDRIPAIQQLLQDYLDKLEPLNTRLWALLSQFQGDAEEHTAPKPDVLPDLRRVYQEQLALTERIAKMLATTAPTRGIVDRYFPTLQENYIKPSRTALAHAQQELDAYDATHRAAAAAAAAGTAAAAVADDDREEAIEDDDIEVEVIDINAELAKLDAQYKQFQKTVLSRLQKFEREIQGPGWQPAINDDFNWDAIFNALSPETQETYQIWAPQLQQIAHITEQAKQALSDAERAAVATLIPQQQRIVQSAAGAALTALDQQLTKAEHFYKFLLDLTFLEKEIEVLDTQMQLLEKAIGEQEFEQAERERKELLSGQTCCIPDSLSAAQRLQKQAEAIEEDLITQPPSRELTHKQALWKEKKDILDSIIANLAAKQQRLTEIEQWADETLAAADRRRHKAETSSITGDVTFHTAHLRPTYDRQLKKPIDIKDLEDAIRNELLPLARQSYPNVSVRDDNEILKRYLQSRAGRQAYRILKRRADLNADLESAASEEESIPQILDFILYLTHRLQELTTALEKLAEDRARNYREIMQIQHLQQFIHDTLKAYEQHQHQYIFQYGETRTIPMAKADSYVKKVLADADASLKDAVHISTPKTGLGFTAVKKPPSLALFDENVLVTQMVQPISRRTVVLVHQQTQHRSRTHIVTSSKQPKGVRQRLLDRKST